jgi:hypothetical protein
MSDPAGEVRQPPLGMRRFRAEHRSGGIVEMSDGTQWEVHPDHEIYTLYWATDAVITVVPGSFPAFPYDLINGETGERVPAKHHSSPKPATGWQLIDH